MRSLLSLASLALLCASLLFSPVSSLTVHIVPHTHDDVGWLKTVDQYYVGLHNEIQHAMVQFILDSVITELAKNPARRFMYVEQAFFQRWWRQQDDQVRNLTRRLVANKQLEFVNGGWCMHDEAATYYVDMIDQTTLGHKFIQQEFGDAALPTIGWQIDPFGHSATQAALLSAEVGFDALFFGRIDWQDHDYRIARKDLEFMWRASPSYGSAGQIFSGAFQSGNYGPPGGFCWDYFCGDDPVQDDPRLNDVNVEYFTNLFHQRAMEQAAGTAGDVATMNIMWNMGSDFQHENSAEWMINIDKIIAAVNANTTSGITAMYSTPSVYVKAKNAEKVTWSVKTDDFFPYSDGPSGYWTGYFTSRPALKRYVRLTGHFLQIARQFEVFSGGDGSSTETLWEAQSVAQHHDGVSGTAKQAVTFDYAQRLAKGSAIADAALQATLAKMVTTTGDAPTFVSCPLANVSICDVSTAGGNLVVLVYNPSMHERRQQVRVVVNDDSVGVSNSNNEFIAQPGGPRRPLPRHHQAGRRLPPRLPRRPRPPLLQHLLRHRQGPHPHPPSLPPSLPPPREGLAEVSRVEAAAANTFIESDLLRLDFDDTTGLIVNYTDKTSGTSYPFTQDFAWYDSYQNDSLPGQLDGAYVFRPMTQTAHSLAGGVTLKVVKGSLVSEVWQTFTPWLSQIVRLRQGSPIVEMEWTVGPIPMDDGQGKNIITRFNTSLASNGTCYTDSNGREFQQRVRNYRATWPWRADEAVSSNLYPVNAAAWLTDGKTALVVNNDRTQAGGSIHDGSFELMLHRRLVSDDAKGVAEPLNEPGLDGRGLIVSGLTTVALVPVDRAAVYARTVQNYVYTYLHQSLAPLTSTIADYVKGHTVARSYAAGVLPDEVELTTLQVAPVPVNGSTVLLRLSHSYGVAEGAQSVTVDLAKLFVQPVKAVVELSLTAATVKKGNSGYVWNTQTGEEAVEAKKPVQQSGTSITLGPLEVRTFGLTF